MEKKILFTASTWSHLARFHRPYLRAFTEMGYGVDAAAGGAVIDLPEVRRTIPLPLEKSMTSPSNLKAVSLLRREIKAQGYSLVITHTSLAAFFTRLAARGLSPAVIYTCHGYLFDGDTSPVKRAILLGAEKLAAGCTDLLLTMNRQDREIARTHRLGKELLEIPGMGVDFDALDAVPSTAGELLRSELALPDNAFLLLYPAEFSPRKSQATLLRALTRLPEHVVLLLPGDGALLNDCKALARELGISHRVVFPGNIDGMSPWYSMAHCAVTSSRSEGLPFNVMEAMHFGLPVAATAVKGHEDLIRDGENGLLFPYGDDAACARQIGRLLADPALSARLGAQARADAEAYRLERVLPQVMAAYCSVLPEGSSLRAAEPSASVK